MEEVRQINEYLGEDNGDIAARVEQMEIENDDLLGNNATRQENVQNNIRQEAGHAEQSLALPVDRFNQRSIPGFLRQNIRHNVDHAGNSIDASRPGPSNSAGMNPNSASAVRDGIEAVNQNINPAQAGIQHQTPHRPQQPDQGFQDQSQRAQQNIGFLRNNLVPQHEANLINVVRNNAAVPNLAEPNAQALIPAQQPQAHQDINIMPNQIIQRGENLANIHPANVPGLAHINPLPIQSVQRAGNMVNHANLPGLGQVNQEPPNLAQQNHQVYQNIDLIPNQNINRGANLNAAVPGFGQMNAPGGQPQPLNFGIQQPLEQAHPVMPNVIVQERANPPNIYRTTAAVPSLGQVNIQRSMRNSANALQGNNQVLGAIRRDDRTQTRGSYARRNTPYGQNPDRIRRRNYDNWSSFLFSLAKKASFVPRNFDQDDHDENEPPTD